MRQKRKFFALILLIFALGVLLPQTQNVRASATTIIPSAAAVATSTDYCFGFAWADLAGTPTGLAAGDYFKVNLFGICNGGTNDGTACKVDGECTGSGECVNSLFDLTDLTISDTVDKSEVNVYFNSADCTGGTVRQTEATETVADDRDLATIAGTALTIKLEDACTGAGACAAGFSIKFADTDVDVNTNTIITSALAGNYMAEWTWGTGTVQDGMDADFLYIGAANEVEISGTVDPTLTLALADWSSGVPNTCPLGTLNTAEIATCSYSVTVTTNASYGFTGYIKSATGLASATDTLTGVGDGTVTAGAEEYGVATNGTEDVTIENGVTCPTSGEATPVSATALDDTDQSLSTASGPVNNTTGKVTVCHAASISGTTPAGLYAQVVTITATASF